jgi:DNA-binding response OmpR family regulator
MRILIVEDEAIVAFSMDDALTAAGQTVVGIARDEQTAIGLAEQYRPDLALVDLSLARGCSGAAVAQSLRERLGIPAIFVSGFPLDCRKVSSHIGALGCLSKPFDDEDLIGAIAVAEAVLDGKSPASLPKGLELYMVV